MTMFQRIFWPWFKQRFCRVCSTRVRRGPRSVFLLLLAIAAGGTLVLILGLAAIGSRLGLFAGPGSVLLGYCTMAAFETLLVWRFDRLRPG